MVGNDIIEVSRIKKLIKEKGDKFLNKIYRIREIDYCESKGPNKYQHYAGKFAAKEAVFKAVSEFHRIYTLETDYEILKLKDIEIFNVPEGTPIVYFWNKSGVSPNSWMILGTEINNTSFVHLSISHVKEYALAVAWVRKLD